MCEDHPASRVTEPDRAPSPMRRRLIAGGAAIATTALAGAALGTSVDRRTARAVSEPVAVAPGFDVWPRAAWGADLPPRGTIGPEDDVRVLLVHHTASSNSWPAVHTMRVTYATHTAQKGWPDVCYHLFVARDGAVYEGRAGSLVRPVVADATGGSQGYSQLVCLLGDYSGEMPTAAAQASLVKALAWLANRSVLDTSADATSTFVSKGSDKLPAGTVVRTPTIAPHRAMTYTSCPGDVFAPHVDADLMARVERQRRAWRALGPSPAVRLRQVTP